MLHVVSRRGRLRLAVVAVLLAALTVPALVQAPTAKALPSTIRIAGHGWGHGRGMGQWGSLGYAVDHNWNFGQILNHYYSNTVMATVGNGPIRVRLTLLDGRDLIVRSDAAFTVSSGGTSIPFAAGGATLIRRVGANVFDVYRTGGSPNSCGGGGNWGAPVRRLVEPTVTPGSKLLQVCEPTNKIRWYRGTLRAVDEGGSHVVNRLAVEDYLRGVVPRESPAYWGTLGSIRPDTGEREGLEALRAQAVAARSYGLSEHRYTGWAETCDTTSCQVYGGVQVKEGSTTTLLEHPLTDRAIFTTPGRIRVIRGTSGPARTEFSSSTGGWSAGGTFPAVADAGDDVSGNPNHNWRADVPRAAIERAWPSVGTLTSIDITDRNGLGAWGGRVVRMSLRGTRGSVTISGDTFRQVFGLRSNWFTVLAPLSPTSATGIAANLKDRGYWIVNGAGRVFQFSGAPHRGDMAGKHLNFSITDIAAPKAISGYWFLGRDGGVFSFGLKFYGSTGNIRLNKPAVAMAAHPSGKGYWFVATDGGVFTYGAARFNGSMGGKHLNRPVVGMAPTPSGKGYWLVATDGGIFAFGDAPFYGSTGNIRLNQPIVAMAATRTGKGYWMVAKDGGIFAFGDAKFYGSRGAAGVSAPIVDMARTPAGNGYWMVASNGTVYGFS